MPNIAMKHYRSAEWDFSMDVPQRWNKFPPVPGNSPNEVIRFASHEDGMHYCIVFRIPRNPKQDPMAFVEIIQASLRKQGHDNFVISEAQLKSGAALMLDCNIMQEAGLWYVREYSIFDETLIHILGFGTSRWDDAQIALFEHMAQSFVFQNDL
jgi:hypothetical protein